MAIKPTLRPGEQPLTGYTVHRLLGKGGLGEVYFATSTAGKEVALKLFTDGRGVQGRGARTVLNLSHPNLVHLYDLVADDKGREWLVMEYVLGDSLDRRLGHAANRPTPAEARAYFADMAAAVAYLHDQNIIHRDLKPANLLLPRGTNRLKVVDFDLCRQLVIDPALTKGIGTEMYMAPELGHGRYDHRVDIYAAGLILAELLTGKAVFDAGRMSAVQREAITPDLSALPTDRFRAVVGRALEKDMDRRYASMAELAADADAAFAELLARQVPPTVPVAPPVAPPPPPVVHPPAPPRTRDTASQLTGGMLAVTAVVGATAVPVWALLSGTDWAMLVRLIVTASAVGWAVLLGTTGLTAKDRFRWDRRAVLAVLGGLVGLLAFWLDGWPTPRFPGTAGGAGGAADTYLFGLVALPAGTFGVLLRYLLYFALALFAARWWRGTATDRDSRLSLLPPMEAAAWGALLLVVWPWAGGSPELGLLALVLAAVAVQAVCPWVRTVESRPARKKRLRPTA